MVTILVWPYKLIVYTGGGAVYALAVDASGKGVSAIGKEGCSNRYLDTVDKPLNRIWEILRQTALRSSQYCRHKESSFSNLTACILFRYQLQLPEHSRDICLQFILA